MASPTVYQYCGLNMSIFLRKSVAAAYLLPKPPATGVRPGTGAGQKPETKGFDMSKTLYERLGGADGLSAIVRDTIANHLKNPTIQVRFQDTDTEKLHKTVFDFFGQGSGGPQKYQGKDMREAHRKMNINGDEFLAVLDDVMDALDKNGIAAETKNEVLGVLYSLKNDVVRL
jgi:hemoglobin